MTKKNGLVLQHNLIGLEPLTKTRQHDVFCSYKSARAAEPRKSKVSTSRLPSISGVGRQHPAISTASDNSWGNFQHVEAIGTRCASHTGLGLTKCRWLFRVVDASGGGQSPHLIERLASSQA